MKDSINNSEPGETAINDELCSEPTCADQFENSECIYEQLYEQYLSAAILIMEKSQPEVA